MSVVRPATLADADGICQLINPIVRDTLVTFTTIERNPQDICAAITEGTPFWVLETQGDIAGYASYAPFRKGPGYARTMEHSIVLRDDHHGQGHGRALMAAVESHARAQAVGSLIAGVSGTNLAGLAFHRALGFADVGVIRRAGYKFDQWVELVLLQKLL